ncbi:hypothetical protein BJ878DRAFT_520462 [Calycina marina]|uniref:Isopenicillin N synthase-like Fe(2+) 2OG dioxygenase domain-containing protein n=1 Tax=Calycina marina TaxID=1763456 RepID=A0A9P8CDP2_9HELO|nr:hypothetical protein BJ878DRAFT_520462 [Calycina marina]
MEEALHRVLHNSRFEMSSNPSESIEYMESHGIPVAHIPIISLAKLEAKDQGEISLLRDTASAIGLFLLSFRGATQEESVLSHLPEVYAAYEKYFHQPTEAKAKDIRLDIKASQDLGWKKGRGGESFEFSRDEVALWADTNSGLPQALREQWNRISEFSSGCDDTCLTMLNSLSTDFAVHHRTGQPSDTGLKAVLHPSVAKLSEVGETLHTDGGTMTLLFYMDWSIHAFLSDAERWAFIPPLEGCALINVGDSLQKMSGGELHSPAHRVTQPFDGAKKRYYLSYYLRPETAWAEHHGE